MHTVMQNGSWKMIVAGEGTATAVLDKLHLIPFPQATPLVRHCLSGCLGAAKHLLGRSQTDVDALVSAELCLCISFVL